MGNVSAIKCTYCEREYPPSLAFDGCQECRKEGRAANFAPIYDDPPSFPAYEVGPLGGDSGSTTDSRGPGFWSFLATLPIKSSDNIVTLKEGSTPLTYLSKTADWLGVEGVWLKDESRNPTWSFKDRLNAVAVSKAREVGASAVIVSSTGNHGASTAAYAAAAGIPCVALTTGDAPRTMVQFMQAYGAHVLATSTLDARWVLMEQCIRELGWYPTGNFVKPPVGGNFYGVEGYKTVAYELYYQLGANTPDAIVFPSVIADLLYGVWRGYLELISAGLVAKMPRLIAAERFGPLHNALKKGLDHVEEVPSSRTVAVSIGGGVSTFHGLRAVRESNGSAVLVAENEIVDMQLALGRKGYFVEASAAVAAVGIKRLVAEGQLRSDERVVMISTSSGLKDMSVLEGKLPSVPVVEPTLAAMKAVLKGASAIFA